ncbi:MAG: prepilin-type N-terminal cleavage/methylation domain-containing protein [Nitrospirae bacterium]|nr:prepilin-type N-terminal cleavage/methylation domain-containing protein [Nitrospirota bacterium]
MNSKGFTLIEILLAVGILGIIFSMVYWTFDKTYDVIEGVQMETDRFRSVRLSLNKMSEEISSVYWREEYKDSLFIGEDIEENGHPMDALRFMSASNYGSSAGGNESDMNIISYYLEKEEEGETYKLIHSEITNIFSASEKDREAYELGESLIGLNLRYFNGTDWVDSWNSDELKAVPLTVEIKIIIKDAGGAEKSFTTLKEIPVGKRIKRP